MLRTARSRAGLCALLALGSLALAGCGDDDAAPADASRADARAPDAGPPDDGQPGGIDAAPIDAMSIDAAPVFCGAFPDSGEPNDSANAARSVPPLVLTDTPPDGFWRIEACLAGTNEDWYLIPASQIRFDLAPDFDGRATMRFSAAIEDTGVCRGLEGCNQPVLPELPENTLTVTLYRASTMEMVSTGTDPSGLVTLDGASEHFSDDFLVRVSGPAEALYDYRIDIYINTGTGEDECEC